MNFEQMTLRELSDWILQNNGGVFNLGDIPSIEDLDDDEEIEVREELESMAYEIMTERGLK